MAEANEFGPPAENVANPPLEGVLIVPKPDLPKVLGWPKPNWPKADWPKAPEGFVSNPLFPNADEVVGASEVGTSLAIVLPNVLGCEVRFENAPKPLAGLINSLEPNAELDFSSLLGMGDRAARPNIDPESNTGLCFKSDWDELPNDMPPKE